MPAGGRAMKILFYIGCLLNIGFFLWEWRNGAFNPPPISKSLPTIFLADEWRRMQTTPDIRILLNRELENLSILPPVLFPPAAAKSLARGPRVKIAEKSASSYATSACLEIGPFSSSQTAKNWMVSQNLNGTIFIKTELWADSYMVYMPASSDAEQDRLRLQTLNAKGVKDFWLLTNGEMKGALSLGLFKEKSRAEAMQSKFAQLGLKTAIKEGYKSRGVVYVRLENPQFANPLPTGLQSAWCEINHE
jgi:hypothetical protein